MKRSSIQFLAVAIAVMVAIQFVPTLPRETPAGYAGVRLAEPAGTVFKRSCFDCHSYKTRWPWYSRVAPVSWLVAHDVGEGRGKLHFSLWSDLDAKKRTKAVEEIWEAVSEGEMPIGIYTFIHRDAVLSDADREIVEEWVRSQGLDPAAIAKKAEAEADDGIDQD